MHAPILKSNITPRREAAMAEGAASGSFGGLSIATPFF